MKIPEESILSNFVPLYIYGSEQQEYCEKIYDLYKGLCPGRKPLAFVKTYGCQQNVSDSEKYTGMLSEMGFGFTDDQNSADVILLNTCAIRENAENKVFGNIGRLKNIKKANPNLFIILCGCMTEQESVLNKITVTYPFIDLVFGTHSVHKFPKLFYHALTGRTIKKKSLCVTEKGDFIIEGVPTKKLDNLKAFLSIMYGCNNFCSYCIVPYVRGRERSRSPEKIVDEFKNLLEAGYKDITLLGQNVNSYGNDLKETTDFPDLLQRLDSFKGEYKIRFMTSHPKDANEKLFDTIAQSRHIAHHVHLPVQCGSDKILKEMNRKYTKDSYLKIIDYARGKIPDIKVEFSSLFTFIYSPREGTPAASFADNVSKQEKTKRLSELLAVQKEIAENLCKKLVGKKFRVLCERFDSKNSCLFCRTDGNNIVEVLGSESLVGKFLDVEIISSKKESLRGKIV
jgi:tRNA-2-methylthio-N6-dimethylallyladenosine synthase